MDWNEFFTYNPDGSLTWKIRHVKWFKDARACMSWNTSYAGSAAGAVRPCNEYGHRVVSILRKRYLIHRIIWEMHHGPIPPKVHVDHIDRDPKNNRLENLRLATNSQNNWNTGKRVNNTSGYKGVSFHLVAQKYRATIGVNGKQFSKGGFDTAEEAYGFYCEMAAQFHGEFMRLE